MRSKVLAVTLILLLGCGSGEPPAPVPPNEDNTTEEKPPEGSSSEFSATRIEISNPNWVFTAERIEGGTTKKAINIVLVLKGSGDQKIRIEADEATGVQEEGIKIADLKNIKFTTEDGIIVTAETAHWDKEKNSITSDATIKMKVPGLLSGTAEGLHVQVGNEERVAKLIRPKITLTLIDPPLKKEKPE